MSALFASEVMRKIRRCAISREVMIVGWELATLIYLSTPIFIWMTGWLRIWVAIPLTLMLAAAITTAWTQTHRYFRRTAAEKKAPRSEILVWLLALAIGVVCLWTYESGAGGFIYSNPDWDKHFAVLRDLVEQPWPVRYSYEGQQTNLVYYLGYYSPAALVGKIAGWWWARAALLLWTCLGASIAAGWFILLVESNPLLTAIYFIFANGMDLVGDRFVNGGPIPVGPTHLDWWSGSSGFFINFPGHTSQLGWAPQHSLAAWSVTGLLAVQLSARRGLGHAGLLVALASFWSPFTVFGLVPLALTALVYQRCRECFTFVNVSGVIFLALSSLFLAAHAVMPPHGYLGNFFSLRNDWPRLLLAYFFLWGVFALFSCELRRSREPWLRVLFWTAVITLAVYPLYRLGTYNDWVMRATIPALFLLWAGVARSIARPESLVERRILLGLCFFGSFGALAEMSRGWGWHPRPIAIEEHHHVPTVSIDEAINLQYLGKEDAFFFTTLAKPSPAFETPTPLLPK